MKRALLIGLAALVVPASAGAEIKRVHDQVTVEAKHAIAWEHEFAPSFEVFNAYDVRVDGKWIACRHTPTLIVCQSRHVRAAFRTDRAGRAVFARITASARREVRFRVEVGRLGDYLHPRSQGKAPEADAVTRPPQPGRLPS